MEANNYIIGRMSRGQMARLRNLRDQHAVFRGRFHDLDPLAGRRLQEQREEAERRRKRAHDAAMEQREHAGLRAINERNAQFWRGKARDGAVPGINEESIKRDLLYGAQGPDGRPSHPAPGTFGGPQASHGPAGFLSERGSTEMAFSHPHDPIADLDRHAHYQPTQRNENGNLPARSGEYSLASQNEVNKQVWSIPDGNAKREFLDALKNLMATIGDLTPEDVRRTARKVKDAYGIR